MPVSKDDIAAMTESLVADTEMMDDSKAAQKAELDGVNIEDLLKVLELALTKTHKNVAEAFAEFDVNDDGCIDREEMRVFVDMYELNWNDAELDAVFTTLDANSDGTVSIEEFYSKFRLPPGSPNSPARSVEIEVRKAQCTTMREKGPGKTRDMQMVFSLENKEHRTPVKRGTLTPDFTGSEFVIKAISKKAILRCSLVDLVGSEFTEVGWTEIPVASLDKKGEVHGWLSLKDPADKTVINGRFEVKLNYPDNETTSRQWAATTIQARQRGLSVRTSKSSSPSGRGGSKPQGQPAQHTITTLDHLTSNEAMVKHRQMLLSYTRLQTTTGMGGNKAATSKKVLNVLQKERKGEMQRLHEESWHVLTNMWWSGGDMDAQDMKGQHLVAVKSSWRELQSVIATVESRYKEGRLHATAAQNLYLSMKVLIAHRRFLKIKRWAILQQALWRGHWVRLLYKRRKRHFEMLHECLFDLDELASAGQKMKAGKTLKKNIQDMVFRKKKKADNFSTITAMTKKVSQIMNGISKDQESLKQWVEPELEALRTCQLFSKRRILGRDCRASLYVQVFETDEEPLLNLNMLPHLQEEVRNLAWQTPDAELGEALRKNIELRNPFDESYYTCRLRVLDKQMQIEDLEHVRSELVEKLEDKRHSNSALINEVEGARDTATGEDGEVSAQVHKLDMCKARNNMLEERLSLLARERDAFLAQSREKGYERSLLKNASTKKLQVYDAGAGSFEESKSAMAQLEADTKGLQAQLLQVRGVLRSEKQSHDALSTARDTLQGEVAEAQRNIAALNAHRAKIGKVMGDSAQRNSLLEGQCIKLEDKRQDILMKIQNEGDEKNSIMQATLQLSRDLSNLRHEGDQLKVMVSSEQRELENAQEESYRNAQSLLQLRISNKRTDQQVNNSKHSAVKQQRFNKQLGQRLKLKKGELKKVGLDDPFADERLRPSSSAHSGIVDLNLSDQPSPQPGQ